MSDKAIKVKIIFISCALALLFTGAIARLYYVHILWHGKLSKYSDRQYFKISRTSSYRGSIYDSSGREMAVSVDSESVYANPDDIKDIKKTSAALSKIFRVRESSIRKSLKKNQKFVWLKRKASPETIEQLATLNHEGINFISESTRFYPNRELAARTVGFVGVDNNGLSGLEYHFDKLIRSRQKKMEVERDALGRSTSKLNKVEDPAAQDDLVLTIDKVIQFIAENELKRQVASTRATDGVVIVMDPMTGDILAMADQPQFNLNAYRKYDRHFWENKAISSVYEPGSTFKVVLAAAAIENGLVQPDEIVNCENGQYKVKNTVIHEANYEKYGELTFREVLAKSSNIGVVKVSEKLSQSNFYAFMKKFGFGEKTGIDLPAESRGILHPPEKWSGTSLASMSFGQGLAVTPLQLISVFSAIANGGTLYRPKIIKEIRKNGKRVESQPNEKRGRIVSEKTSHILTEMLEYAVNEGTGKKAAIEGYRVAGKTGTSQKALLNGRGYSTDKFVSSFAGYIFSAKRPVLAILVVINEPTTASYGGQVAAPVFKNIGEQVLRYLRIPADNAKIHHAKNIIDKKTDNEKSEIYTSDITYKPAI